MLYVTVSLVILLLGGPPRTCHCCMQRSPGAPAGSPFQPRPLGSAKDKAAQPPPPSASLLRQPRGAAAKNSPSAFAFGKPAAGPGTPSLTFGQAASPGAAGTPQLHMLFIVILLAGNYSPCSGCVPFRWQVGAWICGLC